MPISAEEWRARTGMVNASRGFRPRGPSLKRPPSLCDLPSPPPSSWKGYVTALILLCTPLVYKMYVVGVAIMIHLVTGGGALRMTGGLYSSHDGGISSSSIHPPSPPSWSLGLSLVLLNVVLYVAMVIAVVLMSIEEHREKDKCQWRLYHPLHQLNFLRVERGQGEVILERSTVSLCATLTVDQNSMLECVQTRKKEDSFSRLLGIGVVSSILQLSTIVVAMLLLLAGDVERNPGPPLGLDLKTLSVELSSAKGKWHEIGIQLNISISDLNTIEEQYPRIDRRLTEMLAFWLDGNTNQPVCWETILGALKSPTVNKRGLAEELYKKYVEQCSDHETLPNPSGKLAAAVSNITHKPSINNNVSLNFNEHDGKDTASPYHTNDYVQKTSSEKHITSENGNVTLNMSRPVSNPVMTKPTSPGKPQAISVMHDSILLKWTKPEYGNENVTFYTVQVMHEQTVIKELKTKGPHETILVDGLEMSKEYQFKVCPECGEAESGMKSEISHPIETKATTPPGKPSISEVTHESMHLQWTQPDKGFRNVNGYEIYHKKVQDVKWRKIIVSNNSNSKTVTQLDFDSEYIFKIIPVCNFGFGSKSEVSDPVRTMPTSPPGKPRAFDQTHKSIKLEWTPPDQGSENIKNYICTVYQYDRSVKILNTIHTSGDGTKCTVAGLSPETTYAFKIRPNCRRGVGMESEISNSIKTFLILYKPGKPRVEVVTYSGVYLKWDKPKHGCNVVKFYGVLYHAQDDSVWIKFDKFVPVTGHNLDSACWVDSLLPGTGYVFKVQSHLINGTQGKESEISDSIVTKTTSQPGKPECIDKSHNSITLQWTKPVFGSENINSYVIKYQTTVSGNGSISVSNGNENHVVIKGLSGMTQYTFTVVPQCKNGEGEESEGSDPIETLPSCRPGKATSVSATHDSVILTWEKPKYFAKDVKHYSLSYHTYNGLKKKYTNNTGQFYSDHVLVPVSAVTVNVKICGLTHNTGYVFEILPVCEHSADYSIPIECSVSDPIFTMATSAPGKPSKLTTTHNSVTLTWTKPAVGSERIKYYRVMYREKPSPKKAIAVYMFSKHNLILINTEGAKEKITAIDLKFGTKYFFRVQAVCESDYAEKDILGTESEPSDPIETNLTSPPKKPFAINVIHDTITLCWKRPTEYGSTTIDRYDIFYSESVNDGKEWKSVRNCFKQQRSNKHVSCEIFNLNPHTSYVFKVCPVCKKGYGSVSDASDPIVTKATSPPGKPRVSFNTHDSIHVEWDHPIYVHGSVKHYKLSYRLAQVKYEMWSEVIVKQGRKELLVNELKTGAQYIFKVLPICKDNGEGSESEISDPIMTRVTSPPGKPQASNVTYNSVTLSWTKPCVGVPDKYSIVCCILNDMTNIWISKAVTKREYSTADKLEPETSYIFKVIPYCYQGVCSESEVSDVITTKPVYEPVEQAMKEKGSLEHTLVHGVIVGPARSGKSSLMSRLVGEEPNTTSPSTGVANKVVQVEVKKSSSIATSVKGSRWFKLTNSKEAVGLMSHISSESYVPNTSPNQLQTEPEPVEYVTTSINTPTNQSEVNDDTPSEVPFNHTHSDASALEMSLEQMFERPSMHASNEFPTVQEIARPTIIETRCEPPRSEAHSKPPGLEACSEQPSVEAHSQPPNLEASSKQPNFEAHSEPPSVEACSEQPGLKAHSEQHSLKICFKPLSLNTASETLSLESRSKPPSVKVRSEPPSLKGYSEPPNFEASSKWPNFEAFPEQPRVKAHSEQHGLEICSEPPSLNAGPETLSLEAHSKPPNDEVRSKPSSVKVLSGQPSLKAHSEPSSLEACSEQYSLEICSEPPSLNAGPETLSLEAHSKPTVEAHIYLLGGEASSQLHAETISRTTLPLSEVSVRTTSDSLLQSPGDQILSEDSTNQASISHMPEGFEPPLDMFKSALKENKLGEVRDEIENSWSLYLTDTGGQMEFQELLPLLVSGRSIFFVLFRLDRDLDQAFEIEYQLPGGERSEPYTSTLTTKDAILQTLASIAAMDEQGDGHRPKVLIVGTHKDKLSSSWWSTAQSKIQRIDQRIQEIIRATSHYDELVEFASKTHLIFTVNNLSEDDSDFAKIREGVERIVKRGTFKIETPAHWLIFSLALRRFEEKIVTYDDCFKAAQEYGISSRSELDNALKFLHTKMGIVRYFKTESLHDIVIRDPQILFDQVTKVIVKTFTFEKAGRQLADKFKKTGIFSLEEFERISSDSHPLLPPSKLIQLLEHLRIVAPLKSEGEDKKKYFLPCVLAHIGATPFSAKTFRLKRCRIPPLLITFECGYCPKGVPGAVINYLLANEMESDLEWNLKQDEIYRDQISFRVGPYDTVILNMYSTYMELACIPGPHVRDERSIKATCNEVIRSVKEGTLSVLKTLSYSTTAKHSLAFYCPKNTNFFHRTREPHLAVIKYDKDMIPRAVECCVTKDSLDLPNGWDNWFPEESEDESTTYQQQKLNVQRDHYRVTEYLQAMETDQIKRLGGALGLSHPKLGRMTDLPADMVSAWLREEDEARNPTYASLVKALREVGQNGIANTIESDFPRPKAKSESSRSSWQCRVM